MAISSKYGKIDIPKIGDEEPVFVLRAQDLLAIPTMEMYCILATSHKAAVVKTLPKEIEKFRCWGGIEKIPD